MSLSKAELVQILYWGLCMCIVFHGHLLFDVRTPAEIHSLEYKIIVDLTQVRSSGQLLPTDLCSEASTLVETSNNYWACVFTVGGNWSNLKQPA